MTPEILMQVGAAVPSSPVELVTASSAPTKVVLGVLVVLSLVSWTIMIAKWVEFKRAERNGLDFMDEFERSHTLDQAAEIAERAPQSPQKGVMTRAVRFITETTPALAATGDRRARLSASQVEALRQVLDSESGAQRDQLGRFVPSLATIGSVSPLIGLLGTVLGIIEAFIGISTKGSGNIGAVAPGVAEA
ncbi:MAG TPA: MotA/TolQ/ExbB proton channel family protein, partial [Gemmatimonadaceae bacterium]|nr:MotA/TolQ/ExbB proton channel family protein [Gemmatimonadaceae bacterium]